MRCSPIYPVRGAPTARCTANLTKRRVAGEQLEGAEGQKTRDTDGTIDRVPDPPESLKKWLILFKMKNESAGIGLIMVRQRPLPLHRTLLTRHRPHSPQTLRQSGGKPNGTMDRAQFLIALRTIYREWHFKEQVMAMPLAATHCLGIGA